MSGQIENKLDTLLDEICQLKDRMQVILPSYVALLEEISRLPEEFERRCWVSCVEAQLEKLKTGYPEYQAQVLEANLKLMMMVQFMNLAAKMGGMEPEPLTKIIQAGVSIRPSGAMALAPVGDPNKWPDAVIVAYEEFMAIVKRLEDELLKGTIVPASEEEIPKLIYRYVSSKRR